MFKQDFVARDMVWEHFPVPRNTLNIDCVYICIVWRDSPGMPLGDLVGGTFGPKTNKIVKESLKVRSVH